NTVYINDLSEELRYTKRRLRELQKAIPPLPEPHLLYEKIVSQCFDTYACTEAVTSLERKIRALYVSSKPFQERLLEIDLVESRVEHCRLQFLCCRSQLRTLFALPPLLVSLRKMSEEFWGTLMRQPQEVRQGEPLLMDIETIEIVIADHLQTLTSLHDTLANLRLNVQNMKDQETLAFENYVRSTLSKLEQLTMEVKTIVVESALSRERNPDPPEHDNVGEREGIQRIQEEDDIIERNANFMEGIEEPEEGAEEGDWEPAEPEEVAEEGDWEPAEPEEAGEEEEGEPVGAEEDPVDDFPNGLMEEDDEAISRIQRELRNTEQAILDFDRMLRHLEVERLCPPRRYDQGHINKAHERFMRCVFCEAVGHHYSDSCTVVRDVASRNQLIESSKRCKQCLEVICARGLACKKNLTICFYCRRRGH
ncbi:hypothetical protein V3C99_003004, partial [Haemonchus contortus]